MSFELRQKLVRVAGRIRSLRFWIGLALCWLAWAVIGVVLLQLSGRFDLDAASLWPMVVGLAVATAVVWRFAAFRAARDPRVVARRVEARHPELAALLLTAVEVAQQPRTPGKGPNFLQASVLREALEHGRRSDWSDAVSAGNLRAAKLAQFLTLGLLVAVCIGMADRSGALAGLRPSPILGFGPADGAFEVKVDPGNVEIERGASLLVVAEFPRDIPPDATLVVASDAASPDSTAKAAEKIADQSPDKTEHLNMVRSLDDPKFVGRVASVMSDLTYHVKFAGRSSDTYRVKVFDYPELVRADAELQFPGYTSLAPTVIEDVRHVTAVEGTRLTLVCQLNKEVAEARMIDVDEQAIDLQQDATEKNVYRAAWTLAKSQRFKLRLVDSEGRGSRLPVEFVVNVTSNRQPKIALERPARDVEVSPLEELQLKATLTDDFGVQRYGISYALGGHEPHEIILPAEANLQATSDAKETQAKQQDIDYLIDFESLAVEPDQLLSYFVWAEDFGPDGKLRRTMSDMYFAEVRRFEEIYRQGEQPSESEQQQRQQQGEGGAAQEAGELADMQKEIINATWKLIRRETTSEPTAELAGDSRLIADSQQAAIERLSQLADRVEDAESREHVKAAENHMHDALEQLTASADGPSATPLPPALGAEQSAFQTLLKLRAREFQVIRGGQQQGQGSPMAGRNSRSQRQLNQLELSHEVNRYETQRSATTPQETESQRESREILNRLKDLARRQDDLNERLRELQSALQQADSQQSREELERELKRLRDQQQQILRDTDELMSQMDQSQNQQAAQNAREQMGESRSRLQQASEALEQGQMSQAITEGTRAERQLADVRDQYRQQAANRFSEEMTEMRHKARALDERQEQLSEQLTEQQNEGGRSLRGSGNRAEAHEGLAEQRRNLGQLLDRMQQTVTEAEQPEPLLARQLYDTLRETHQQRIDDSLDVTQRLLEVGVEREADRAMRNASRGIRNLREGVERAAESVLGDEAEALRRAQQEVDRLAEELNREITQNRGDEGASAPEREQDLQGQGGSVGRSEETRSRQGGSRSAANDDAQAAQGENHFDENQLVEDQPEPDRQRVGRQPGQGQSGRGEPPEQQSDGQGRVVNSDRQRSEEENPEQTQGGGAQRGRGNRVGGNRRGDRNDSEQDGNGAQRGTRSEGQQPDRTEEAPAGGEGGRVDESQEQQSLRGDRQGSASRGGGVERFLENGGFGGPGGPITGDNFRNWSERIGDVEEMLDDPGLRGEAARIRDRAIDARAEFKRHSKVPDWDMLQELVAEPLNELSRRIGEEIKRRELPDSLVPIDRDPVPPEFSDGVRRYYERLGSGE